MKVLDSGLRSVKMFRKNDQDYLISQIPRFKLSLATIRDLSYYNEILDVRLREEFCQDHILRPEVRLAGLSPSSRTFR